jgi:single-strand DNA-binding protein
MNKAILIGNLVRDVELRTTQNSKSVASLSLATNETFTNANGEKVKKVEFHNIVAWGKTAELLAQYCSKGKKIMVIGKLQTTDWTGQDGIKRFKTEILANEIEFLSPSNNENRPKEQPMKENESIDIPAEPEEEEIKVENIPF